MFMLMVNEEIALHVYSSIFAALLILCALCLILKGYFMLRGRNESQPVIVSVAFGGAEAMLAGPILYFSFFPYEHLRVWVTHFGLDLPVFSELHVLIATIIAGVLIALARLLLIQRNWPKSFWLIHLTSFSLMMYGIFTLFVAHIIRE